MDNNENNIIDFVITWVDGSDEKWLQEKAKYKPGFDVDDSLARYRDFNTLKYLLRSIEKFAPWVRYVFLITNGQVPSWLSLEHKKLKLVKHSDYMREEYLPTFSSHPIEWNIHNIEGLSENFVYFNDDQLLTDYVEPTDFFKNGVPCDEFGLGMVRPVEFFSYIPFNHMMILNRHFVLKDVLKQNWKKMFSLKYGARLIKTCILSNMPVFYGMHDPHLAIAFNKSNFNTLWEKEYDLIDQTCKNKFRSKNDVSIWLVRYFQLLQGKFVPRSNRFGKFFMMHDFVNKKNIRKKLLSGKYKTICVNDSESTKFDFETEREKFCDIMDSIFHEKSSFEL